MLRAKTVEIATIRLLDQHVSRVLAGGVRPSAAELVELIRQINPTGRGLPAKETQRRYQLKSRLQSLLLRRFGEDVEILVEPGREDVVLLRCRGVERGDAAHAILAELDDDARSMVQHHLDSAGAAVHEAPPPMELLRPTSRARAEQTPSNPGSSASTSELLRQGRAAMAEYDYESARAHFEAALRSSGGALVAALPLCELLVDHLAADEDVLNLVPLLAAEAVAHAAVRAQLALASARLGEQREAERWLRGLDDAAAAPVWLALAQRALADQAAEAATEYLERARALCAPAADVLRLSEALAELQRVKWRSQEVELERCIREESVERVEVAARALLKHWPESPAARRALALVAQQRRKEQGERLCQEALQALAQGNVELAAQKCRLAREHGLVPAELEQGIQIARQEREQAQLQACVAELTCARACAEALGRYLQLPQQLRVDVRRAAGNPILDWLEALELPRASASTQAAIEAVLALQHAETLPDPAAVLAALLPHEKTLERLDHARRLLARTQATLRVRRHQQTEEQLTRAEAELVAEELAAAEQRLAGVQLRGLDAPVRERMRQLKERLVRRQGFLCRVDDLQRYLAADDLLRAQEEVTGLLDLCEPVERPNWAARQLEIAERIRQQWCLREFSLSGTGLADLLHTQAALDYAACEMETFHTQADRELILAHSHGGWLILFIVDVQDATVRQALTLRTPKPLVRPRVIVGQQRVYVVSAEHALVLDWTHKTVCAWKDLRTFVPPEERIELVCGVPGTDYLWICSGGQFPERATVVDARRWRARRVLQASPTLQPYLGGPAPAMTAFDYDDGARLYDASGALGAELGLPERQTFGLAIHPTRRGSVALLAEPPPDAPEAPLPLALVEVNSKAKELRLEGSHYEQASALITSLAEQLAFVAHYSSQGIELQAYGATESGLQRIWRTRCAQGCVFVQDLGAQHVRALFPTRGGLALAKLGRTPPAVPQGGESTRELPSLSGRLWCQADPLELPGAVQQQLRERRTDAQRRELIEQLRAQYAPDVAVLLAMTTWVLLAQRSRHLDFIEGLHPGHPLLAYYRTDLAVAQQSFAEAGRYIEAIEVEQLPPRIRRHFLHLVGIVRMRAGNLRGARQAWKRAARQPGMCRVEICIEWLDALHAAHRPIQEASHQSRLQILAHGLRIAERDLACGDFEGARRSLEHPAILATKEIQSLARLAAAYLNLPSIVATDGLRFLHKALVLTRLCSWRPDSWNADGVFLPRTQWGAERLKSLQVAAQAWIREHLGPPWVHDSQALPSEDPIEDEF